MNHVSWGNLRCLLSCKALGETRAQTRKLFLRKTCVVYLIVRTSVGRGLSLEPVPSENLCCSLIEDVSWGMLCFFVHVTVWPSLGRGIGLDDVSWQNWCYLPNCKACGGSRVGRCLRLEDVSRENLRYATVSSSGGSLCCLFECKAFGRSRVKTPRCTSRKLVLFT